MIYFNCDYTEGAHPKILEKLAETNMEQTIGYGMDEHCKNAAELIKKACGREDADVHFLVGGTQTNVTVIDASLRAHQGVICASSGHINVHETGAVVISNPQLKPDFRYAIKQHGGMLAKGRLLGIQFETLFQDGLYFEIAKHAMDMAERISNKFMELGVEFTVASPTNQIFVGLPKTAIAELSKTYKFEPMGTKDDIHDMIRICTSWATKEENVTALLADIERVLA